MLQIPPPSLVQTQMFLAEPGQAKRVQRCQGGGKCQPTRCWAVIRPETSGESGHGEKRTERNRNNTGENEKRREENICYWWDGLSGFASVPRLFVDYFWNILQKMQLGKLEYPSAVVLDFLLAGKAANQGGPFIFLHAPGLSEPPRGPTRKTFCFYSKVNRVSMWIDAYWGIFGKIGS